jgi:uncharacterized protein (TIGR03437 family)
MATSPGSLATLYGAAFPASTAAASSLSNLPTSLGGLELFVRDAKGDRRPAPLLYVSPTQVNFQVPEGSAIGTGQVEAKVNGAYTSIGVIEVRDAAPALFSAVSAFPKAPTVVTFYGTGFRGANTSNVQVVIQGTAYTPGSVRPVAGMTGVDAIEVPIFDNPSWVFPGIPYGGGAVVFRGTLTNLVHTGLPH